MLRSALVLREAGWARGDAGGCLRALHLLQPGLTQLDWCSGCCAGDKLPPWAILYPKSMQPAGMAIGCHSACQGHGRENQPQICSCLSKPDSPPLLHAPLCQVKEEGDQLGCPVLPVCSLHSCLEALKGRQSKLGISLSLLGFQEEMAGIKNLMQSNGGVLIFLSSRGKKAHHISIPALPSPSPKPPREQHRATFAPCLASAQGKALTFYACGNPLFCTCKRGKAGTEGSSEDAKGGLRGNKAV